MSYVSQVIEATKSGSTELIDILNVPNYISLYLYFDTNNMVFNGTDTFKWGLNYGNEKNEGSVNVLFKPRFIKGIRFIPIRLPIGTASITIDDINRWGVLIDEFQTDSMHTSNSNFHFVMTKTSNVSEEPSKYLETTTKRFNNGYYWFYADMLPPSTITFKFSNLMDYIKVPNQYSKWKVLQGSNPLQLTPYDLVSPYTLGLEQVYISGFTTGNIIADDSLIKSVNQLQTITSLSGSDILIGAINTTGMTPLNGDIIVIVKSKLNYRNIFGLEFLCTMDESKVDYHI